MVFTKLLPNSLFSSQTLDVLEGERESGNKHHERRSIIMTQNQIAYANYIEQQRNNVATLAETSTHNRNVESETKRSNKAQEKLTRRRDKETRRSNKAQEKIQNEQLEETKTHNRNTESEQHRSNTANEQLKLITAQIAAEASKFAAQVAADARVTSAQIAAAMQQTIQNMRDIQSQADRDATLLNNREQRDLERAIKAAERYQQAVLAEDKNDIERYKNETERILAEAQAYAAKQKGGRDYVEALNKIMQMLQSVVNAAGALME